MRFCITIETSQIGVSVLNRSSALEIFIQLLSGLDRLFQISLIYNLAIILCHRTGNKHSVSDLLRVRFCSQLQVCFLPRGRLVYSPLGH